LLQIRIADFDGTDPIILEHAKNRVYAKTINSADEGIAFDIAKSDPKAEVLNPDQDGYTKRWEVWDTETNARLNFGPITSITEEDTDWKVSGAGRSALLGDFYKTLKTFYAPIISVLDDVRYENLSIQPRTISIIPDVTASAAQTTVFGSSVDIDEKYNSLSKQTKDFAIDDNTGRLKPGEVEPSNTFYATDSYWSGMSRSDTHIVDLGGIYPVNKIQLVLPSWGGPSRRYNRSYTYRVSFAITGGTTLQDRTFGSFTTLFSSTNPNRELGGMSAWVGYDGDGNLTTSETYEYLQPIQARYIRTEIINTHAWYGSQFDAEPSVDGWNHQCNPDYVTGSIPSISTPGILDKEISTRTLEAANDCHASISEIITQKNIVDRDLILPLGLQRIDNNNLQISYSHNVQAAETLTTSSGFRKFEPGSFFRRVSLDYSGANTSYTKFYSNDCSNCFPDGFNFGVMDQHNNLVYSTDNTSGTPTRTFGAYTKHITMKGASNAVVTWCDAWKAKTDLLSWGGSYSYTEITNDTAIIHFRGQSFKWYATVPSGKTGAQATLTIRNKDGNGEWTSWSALDTITLPNDINNEVVYNISYESGILLADTIYEIRIENDGGYLSIDSIEGYWSASLVEYNEDSLRISVSRPEKFKQIYDKRYSGGSMFKIMEPAYIGFRFTGDRLIILSAKGRNHGRARLLIKDLTLGAIFDEGTSNHVFIPGGSAIDGSLTVDLDTGKAGNEITQYVLFDSNISFPNGLPWALYSVHLYLYATDVETYTADTADIEFDSFVRRCRECDGSSGDTVTVNKPIFLDSIFAHEVIGLSVSFDNEQHLEILKATTEALQVEWDVTDAGLRVEPRIGEDTDEYLREGENTLVNWQIVNDVTQMASMLISHGADIDGLPLFALTEDKGTRARLGRTVMRQQDFRNIADYMQLIGLSRTELKRRSYPQKRITVTHVANHLALSEGDSFLLWTKKMGTIRVRIQRIQINESSGRTYDLECVTWPQIT